MTENAYALTIEFPDCQSDLATLLLNDGAKRNRLLYLKIMHTGVRKILCLHKILRQLFCLPFDAYRSKKNLMFAQNFEATPFLGERFFFLMLHKQKFARNFEATPFLGESIFSDAT